LVTLLSLQPGQDSDRSALPVRRAPDLYLGLCGSQYFVHNPNGYEALALLSRHGRAMLEAADGRPAREVAWTLADADADEAHKYLSELPILLRNGFVRAPGVRPWQPTDRAERVFNTWLHLTNACNLACPYCYIHKDAGHLGAETKERVLRAIEATARSGDVDRVHVRFAGGEPMLRFTALQRFHHEATEACSRHGVRFSAAVLTNGTVMSEAAAAWLRDAGVSVSVSIDGVGATQDVMRPVVGGGSSAARVEAGLDVLQTAGIVPYGLVTVGDSNLEGLPDLARWLSARGIGFRLSLVRDLEWGRGLLDDRHGAGQAPCVAEPEMLAGEALWRVQRVLGQTYDVLETAVIQGTKPSFRRTHRFCDLELWRPIKKACGAGESYLAISDKGEVSPCQAALHQPGTQALRPESLPNQAQSQSQLGSFSRKSGNSECNRCRHRSSCAGGCPLLLHRRSGAIEGRSPYCEVFRAVIPRILRIAAQELQREEASRVPAVVC